MDELGDENVGQPFFWSPVMCTFSPCPPDPLSGFDFIGSLIHPGFFAGWMLSMWWSARKGLRVPSSYHLRPGLLAMSVVGLLPFLYDLIELGRSGFRVDLIGFVLFFVLEGGIPILAGIGLWRWRKDEIQPITRGTWLLWHGLVFFVAYLSSASLSVHFGALIWLQLLGIFVTGLVGWLQLGRGGQDELQLDEAAPISNLRRLAGLVAVISGLAGYFYFMWPFFGLFHWKGWEALLGQFVYAFVLPALVVGLFWEGLRPAAWRTGAK